LDIGRKRQRRGKERLTQRGADWAVMGRQGGQVFRRKGRKGLSLFFFFPKNRGRKRGWEDTKVNTS